MECNVLSKNLKNRIQEDGGGKESIKAFSAYAEGKRPRKGKFVFITGRCAT